MKKILICLIAIALTETVSAQGFLGKVKNMAKSATSSTQAEATETAGNKIKVDEIPTYTAKKVYELDENGERIKNEDGTDKYRVMLVNNKGEYVTPEYAKEQHKKINNAILAIAGKAAVGAGVGALSGGGKGALIGLASGLGLSVPDLMTIIKMKKDINKQSKVLAAYEKSFNEEGLPTSAKLDPKVLKDLNLSEDNSVSSSTADIMKELEAAKTKTADSENSESLEALLAAGEAVKGL